MLAALDDAFIDNQKIGDGREKPVIQREDRELCIERITTAPDGNREKACDGQTKTKFPAAAESLGQRSTERSVRGKIHPRPPDVKSVVGNTNTERSWLAFRKTLHERYRDFEEHGAAEKTAADARQGLGSRGAGWEGEVLAPGLR